jgi:hypothetical protein
VLRLHPIHLLRSNYSSSSLYFSSKGRELNFYEIVVNQGYKVGSVRVCATPVRSITYKSIGVVRGGVFEQ